MINKLDTLLLLETFDLVDEGMIIHNLDTSILYANQKARDVFKLNLDETTTKDANSPVWFLLNENGEKIDVHQYPVNEISNSKTKSIKDKTYGVKVENTITWIKVSGKIVYKDDTPSHIAITFSDITHLKQHELNLENKTKELEHNIQQLHKQQDDLNQAQRLANLGHWEFDLVNNKLYWSNEVYRIFGLETQEFDATYEAFLNYVHPDDHELVNSSYSNSVKNKINYEVDHRVITKQGDLKYVTERCYHEIDDNGDVVKSLGTILDVTQRVEQERELELLNKRQESFLSLFDKGDTVLFRWRNDEHWSVEYVSNNISKLLGYEKEQFLSNEIVYANCIDQVHLHRVLQEVQAGKNSKENFFKHEPYKVVTKDNGHL